MVLKFRDLIEENLSRPGNPSSFNVSWSLLLHPPLHLQFLQILQILPPNLRRSQLTVEAGSAVFISIPLF